MGTAAAGAREAARQAPESVVERQIAIAKALAPAIGAVVANHVGTDTPVILEGDYVLPGPATPQVRSVPSSSTRTTRGRWRPTAYAGSRRLAGAAGLLRVARGSVPGHERA